MRPYGLLLTLLALTGCVSSHVMIGQARPPISPEAVKIYFHPPTSQYEEIAMLDTSSRAGFGITAQGKTDVVIRRLKEEAAKLGANGVLLSGVGNETTGAVSTGFGSANANGNTAFGTGFGLSSGINQKTGQGIAIYVPPTP
jgi:hypothetical protein